MRISAKADYAVRGLAVLAAHPEGDIHAEQIARVQQIPLKFLLNIFGELVRAGIVLSHRGAVGGYRLARSPDQISLADVIRAVEGPLASVHGQRPEEVHYPEPAEALSDVWIAVRYNLRAILENVSLAELVDGDLPPHVLAAVSAPESWEPRRPRSLTSPPVRVDNAGESP